MSPNTRSQPELNAEVEKVHRDENVRLAAIGYSPSQDRSARETAGVSFPDRLETQISTYTRASASKRRRADPVARESRSKNT